MSRLPSIDMPGALYYIQLQSNGQRQLLSLREDFAYFRQLFEPWTQNTGLSLLGYCLLPDSLHFLLRAGSSGVDNCLHWLIDTHTQDFNQRQQRNGSVFSQQKLITVLDPQHYLLPALYKLHWLPVKAGMVSSPLAYPWSSHRDYLNPDPPAWLNTQEALVKIANHRAGQLRRYEQFIEQSQQASIDWVEGVNDSYRALASDKYLQNLLGSNRDHRLRPAIDLEALTEWVCGDYQIETNDLRLWRNHRLFGEIQAVVGALAQTFSVCNLSTAATFFDTDIELLRSGIRALQARRGMYLFKLQLRLDQWLINQFQLKSGANAEDEIKQQSLAPKNESQTENTTRDISVGNEPLLEDFVTTPIDIDKQTRQASHR